MGASFQVSTIFNGRDRMSPAFNRMSRSATSFGNVLTGILGADIIRSGFRNLARGAASFIEEAQKIEDATARFQPLMGSLEGATELVNRLNQEAATTPFQFEGIANVASQLLPVMNGSIEDTANTFRMLGDTAGGNMQRLESITRGYTKALLKGRPDMEALNMIAEAGVPIFSEMASTIGVSQEQLFELSRQGALTNDQLTATFQRMTEEGGLFFNGMQIASETFSGRVSTLKDNLNLVKAAIGSELLPLLKPMVDRGIEIAGAMRQWFTANQGLITQRITDFIQQVVDLFERAAPILQKIAPIVLGIVAAFTAYSVAMRVAAVAQGIFNAVIGASPITWIILAIGALIGIIYLLATNWDMVKDKAVEVWAAITTAVGNAVDWMGSALLSLGRIIMTAIFSPVNLVIDALQGLIGVFTRLPGRAGEAFQGASDALQAFQNDMNRTMTGSENAYDFGAAVNGNDENRDAPNRREAEARQQVSFEGQLNIAGAPEGSTFDSTTRGAPPMRTALMGAQ